MTCPDFANIDELLDQLEARWLFAIELGRPTDLGDYQALFRIAFEPTVGGMQFSLCTLRHGTAGYAMYFVPEAREELKQRIAALIEEFEEGGSAFAPGRERSGSCVTNEFSPMHHLYPVASEDRRHSAR